MNSKIEKTLNGYSEKLGIPIDTLKQRFKLIRDQEIQEYPGKTNKAYDERAMIVLRGDLRRETGTLSRRGKTFIGFFFGDTGVLDFVEIMKNKAEAWYKDPSRKAEAIAKHMITRDGVPLDTREKIGWAINPAYGEPLTGHSYYRALYGIFGLANEHTDFRFRKLHFNGELALDVDFQPYKTCTLRATERKTDSDRSELNATKYTKFQYVELPEGKELDFDELIKNCGETIYTIEELENLYTLLGKDPEHPVLIEANVPIINYELREGQRNRLLILDDQNLDVREEGGITCFIQGHFPLDFGRDSRVIILGSLDKRSRDDKEEIMINAIGCYPLKKFHRKRRE